MKIMLGKPRLEQRWRKKMDTVGGIKEGREMKKVGKIEHYEEEVDNVHNEDYVNDGNVDGGGRQRRNSNGGWGGRWWWGDDDGMMKMIQTVNLTVNLSWKKIMIITILREQKENISNNYSYDFTVKSTTLNRFPLAKDSKS